jgi:hypothetical protein
MDLSPWMEAIFARAGTLACPPMASSAKVFIFFRPMAIGNNAASQRERWE